MRNFTISTFFNQLTAMPKRLAATIISSLVSYKRYYLLLTILLTLGVGQMWGETWELVTDASTLKAGDELVIVSNGSSDFVAGDISSNIMASVSVTISNNTISSLPNGAVVLTLGGSSGSWTLTNASGQKLGATAVKKVAWGSGTTTWSISISSNNATIQNTTSSYGRFLYNVSSPRFTTYTSDANASMLLPQLYRKKASCIEPTVAWKTDPADGEIGNTMIVSVTTNYSAGLTYSSSNTNVATINNSGNITYKAEGTTTITAQVTGDGTTYCNETVTLSKQISVTCGYNVKITKGTETNGTFTLGTTGTNGTCGGDLVVKLSNIKPATNYQFSEITQSGINTGVTIDQANKTVTYAQNTSGTSTINVTFDELPKFTVTWSVDGSTTTEQVYENGKASNAPTISTLPCGDKFVGWTTGEYQGISAPGTLYPTAADIPAITDDITFYAVFADYVNE